MKPRLIASLGLAVGVMLTATGCGFVAPQATTHDYHASDGVNATVGDIKVLNALVLSDDGDEGNLSATLANASDKRVIVTLQFESNSAKVDRTVSVPAKGTASIGTADDMFILEGINSDPGSLMPIFVQYGSETGVELKVPVLDGTLAEYSELVP